MSPSEFINKYILTFSNPLIYIFLLSIILVLSVILVFKYVYLPIKIRDEKEKDELEQKNLRLMSLFAEVDPDPVLRIDPEGIITHANNAAYNEFNKSSLIGENIYKIIDLRDIKVEFMNLIKNDRQISFTQNIGENYYAADVKGISSLEFAHVYFHNITERIKYEKEVEAYKDRLKILSEYLDTKREEEKDTVSKYLHDDIGQRLFSLKLILQKLETDKNSPAYYNLIKELDNTYKDVRDLSHDLKPVKITELGILAALTDLVENISSTSGIEGSISHRGNEISVNSRIELCLYRVAQEALLNMIKHSKATEFLIYLINDEKNIKLIISDNGVGMDTTDNNEKNLFHKGIGLFNIKERVEYLNGTVNIESSPEEGFTLIASLPTI